MNNEQETEEINSAAVINHYLNELMANNKPLLLNFQSTDADRVFESRILKVDKIQQLIHLRMFTPQWTEDKQMPDTVSVKTWLDQGSLQFMSAIPPIEDTHPDAVEDALKDTHLPNLFRIRFPKSMVKQQQRSAYRVSLVQQDAKVAIADGESILLEGLCHDFSMGGTLCQVDEKVSAKLETGMIFDNCQINIQGMINFTCRAELTHIRPLKNGHKQLGLQFIDLEAHMMNKIARVIAKIERDNIRGLVQIGLPGQRLAG